MEELALISYAVVDEEETESQQQDAQQLNEFMDSLDELFDEAFTNG